MFSILIKLNWFHTFILITLQRYYFEVQTKQLFGLVHFLKWTNVVCYLSTITVFTKAIFALIVIAPRTFAA